MFSSFWNCPEVFLWLIFLSLWRHCSDQEGCSQEGDDPEVQTVGFSFAVLVIISAGLQLAIILIIDQSADYFPD